MDGQAAVIEKPLQRDALVTRVPDARGDRRLVEHDAGLVVAPVEELLDDGARLGTARLFSLLSRRSRDGPFDAEYRTDETRSGSSAEARRKWSGDGDDYPSEDSVTHCPGCGKPYVTERAMTIGEAMAMTGNNRRVEP